MNLKNTLTALAGTTLAACVIAGSAWGATAGWQDVWNQIKPILSTPGTVNAADNPVHWTKLKGVPAGFADGLDNGVDRAGFGLKKNVFPELELAVDPAKIQRRVTGACATGRAVQSIAADGTVTCSPISPDVVFGSKHPASAQPVYDIYTTVGGALDVPAGSWSIVAKVDVSQGSNLAVRCELDSRTDGKVAVEDTQLVSADSPESGAADVPVTLLGAHTSTVAWRAAVRCRTAEHPTWWHDVKIVVTRANRIDAVQLTQ